MKTLLSAVLVLGLSSCSTVWRQARSIDDETQSVPRVIVGSATLRDILRVGSPLAERLQPEGFLRVVVPVRNIDIEPVRVLAEVVFLDRAQLPLPGDGERAVLDLLAGGTSNFQAISQSPEAAEYEVRLTWDK